VPLTTLGRGRICYALLAVLLLAFALTPSAARAAYDEPVEDYASYQPQKQCRDQARPGTKALNRWINRKFGGGTATASVRSCNPGTTSEHEDGRAIDWSMNATKRAHRLEVRRFLDKLFAADAGGNAHARARRMGVMYIIWNDRMYASYRAFTAQAYKSSSCKRLRSCSATLRHRDHVHISLGKPGARGDTSWYAGRL
jgi:hypothetical protein